MTQFMLHPIKDVLDVKGSISYSNTYRAWNTIRFPSLILRKFPQLRQKQSNFFYRMVLYDSFEELESKIKVLKENKDALPILMWLETN